MNSLFKFDPEVLLWTELTKDATGLHPISRNWPAYVTYNGRLYLFGGIELSSLQGAVSSISLFDRPSNALIPFPAKQIVFGDFWGLNAPNNVVWPAGTSNEFFLNVYDWDTVVISAPNNESRISSNASSNLLSRIELCTGFYPCALTISGAGAKLNAVNGVLWQSGTGSIICLKSSGCTGLQVHLLKCVCAGKSKDSMLQVSTSQLVFSRPDLTHLHDLLVPKVEGSKMLIRGSTFVGCSSQV